MDRVGQPLRLKARDGEDLKVLAACLQDSILPLADMAWLRQERRLVMVLNRFMWERAGDAEPGRPADLPEPEGDADFAEALPEPHFQRTNCAFTVERVRAVATCNLSPGETSRLLVLLTLTWQRPYLLLTFADGVSVRVTADELHCRMEDLGEPWPTWSLPRHDLDGPPPSG